MRPSGSSPGGSAGRTRREPRRQRPAPPGPPPTLPTAAPPRPPPQPTPGYPHSGALSPRTPSENPAREWISVFGRPGAVWRAGARTPCRGPGHLMTCPKSRHPVPGPCSCPKSPAFCARQLPLVPGCVRASRSGCCAAGSLPWLPSRRPSRLRAPPVIPGPTWYRGPACPLTRRVASSDFQGGNPPGEGCPLWWRVRRRRRAGAGRGGGEAGRGGGGRAGRGGAARRRPGRGRRRVGLGEARGAGGVRESEGEEGGGVLPHDGFVFGGGEVGGFEGADGY